MLPQLNLHIDLLRIDWPLLLSATALGATLLGGVTMGLQMRRTRRRVLGTLERVFEQLDLMRLDTQPEDVPELAPVRVAAVARPDVTRPDVASGRAARAPLARANPGASVAPAELADYQTAARLAARGAPLAEIADRCGVVAGEARVLLALQQRLANAGTGAQRTSRA